MSPRAILRGASFSALTPSHSTPRGIYDELDGEFHFTLDPCPLNDAQIWDGALMSWAGHRVFCNPPYGRGLDRWLAKAREAECAVYLLPARTDTKWWHEHALQADEIRFVRGRLKFGAAKYNAPFPSVVLVYRGARKAEQREAVAKTMLRSEREIVRRLSEELAMARSALQRVMRGVGAP